MLVKGTPNFETGLLQEVADALQFRSIPGRQTDFVTLLVNQIPIPEEAVAVLPPHISVPMKDRRELFNRRFG